MSRDTHLRKVSHLVNEGKLAIGDGYRAKNSELSRSGLPFARAGNIDGGFNFEDADCFPEKDLRRVGDKVSKPGDVVFTSKGTVGRFAFVRESTPPFVFSPQLCYWRSLDANSIHPRFLLYWMHGEEFWEQADAVKGQTDMADYVSLTDQRMMSITLPDIGEQRAIAEVLGALDDKIELNRQMNHTLEEMASALFERLMAEVDDDTTRETSVQALIDRKLLVVGDGYRAKNDELAPAGLPFARAGNIDAGFLFADAELLGWPAVARAGAKVSVPFDVVFTSKGTVGRFAFVSPTTPKFAYSPQLCFWRSANHDALSPFFLYHWMRSSRFLEQVDAVKGQTDMADYVSLTDQRLMKMACPKAGDHARLRDEVAALWDLHFANTDESKTLAALRDALLPKLLSGEVRLKQAEKAVEAAL
jgi:type I restriction enzyme S subunit